MQVELAQLALIDSDVAHNTRKVVETIGRADTAGGTKLIVFPETTLSGFPTRENIADVAQTLDGPALFTVANATAGLLHDLRKTHFILQRREFPPQARQQLNENALYARMKSLAVAIEQPNRSQVLHVPSRDRREGGRRDKRFVSVTTLMFTTLSDV